MNVIIMDVLDSEYGFTAYGLVPRENGISMDTKQALQEAVSALEEVDVPEPLREIAFTKVLESLLEQAGMVKGLHTKHSGSGESSGAENNHQSTKSVDIIDQLAAKLQMDVDVVGSVFSDLEGEPHLNLQTSQLPGTKSAATKDIALLIVFARQSLGIDDFTSVDEIRKVAEHFNKYDSSNFAGTISSMSSVFRVQGKGQSRKLKLNQPGKESAIALLKKYSGVES